MAPPRGRAAFSVAVHPSGMDPQGKRGLNPAGQEKHSVFVFIVVQHFLQAQTPATQRDFVSHLTQCRVLTRCLHYSIFKLLIL